MKEVIENGTIGFPAADPLPDIGVGRFRMLGGQGLEYWGGQGGAKFPAGT